jgi:hypothetical protein
MATSWVRAITDLHHLRWPVRSEVRPLDDAPDDAPDGAPNQ